MSLVSYRFFAAVVLILSLFKNLKFSTSYSCGSRRKVTSTGISTLQRSSIQPSNSIHIRRNQLFASQNKDAQSIGGSVSTKVLFAATELFGKFTASFETAATTATNSSVINLNTNTKQALPVLTDKENRISLFERFFFNLVEKRKAKLNSIANMIRQEYEAIFWATGNMDTTLWQNVCNFSF